MEKSTFYIKSLFFIFFMTYVTEYAHSMEDTKDLEGKSVTGCSSSMEETKDFEDKSFASRTTTQMLQTLQSSSDRLTKNVADCILNNWDFSEINRTNHIGFWWHKDGGNWTNVIYAHASSNPRSHPNGPWPIEIKSDDYWQPNGEACKNNFLKAGFACVGSTLHGDDQVLEFQKP